MSEMSRLVNQCDKTGKGQNVCNELNGFNSFNSYITYQINLKNCKVI